MPTVVVSGLFGLAGVLLGGLMAIVSARWQSSSSERSRLAELKIQLQNERFLRDEAKRQSAILELIAALERFNSAVVQVTFIHSHGDSGNTWPDVPCSLGEFSEVRATGFDFYQLFLRRGALVSATLTSLRKFSKRYSFTGNSAHFNKYWYKPGQHDNPKYASQYCELGLKIATLELPIRNCVAQLKSELKNLLAVS